MRFETFATQEAREPSLLVQIWQEFIATYVTNDAYYENLGLGGTSLVQIKILLLGMFLGLAVAAFCIVYDKRVLGNMVRTILGLGCLSPEKAQTLSELGYARNSIVRYSVRKSVALRRVVRCVEEEAFLAEQKRLFEEHEEKRKADKSIGHFRETSYVFDLENDHFYIPEELKYTADIKFEKKGNTWLGAIVFTVIVLVLYVLLLLYFDEILKIVDAFFANFRSSGSNNIV